MSNEPADRHSLLRHDNSDLSDTSRAIPSPGLPSPHQRHAYQRMGSSGADDYPDPAPQYTSPGAGDTTRYNTIDDELRGLGIIDRTNTIPRRPVGNRRDSVSPIAPSIHTPPPQTPPTAAYAQPTSARASPNVNQSVPNSSNPLLSPAGWTRHTGTGTFAYDSDRIEAAGEPSLTDRDILKKKTAFAESIDVAFGDSGDETDGRRSHRDHDHDHDHDHEDHAHLLHSCPTTHDIHSSRKSWLSICILAMSIYSTIFSGIWLVIALVQPRYGKAIHSGGDLSPETASILFALFAKSIELSFVTVFVTFLGQVLSRRSLVKASRGVTIAELSMRTWVIQPGFMITHGEHLKHVGITILGCITLTATFVAMFYTTASDALVSPHLKYGKPQSKILEGLVKASFANPLYAGDDCKTPVSKATDPTYYGTTCLALMHAGQAYHNSQSFLETWSAISKDGKGVSTNIADRPRAPGMIYDNTTVIGSWVTTNSSNMTASFQEHGRIINNVTLAMPHAGVINAAQDKVNGILQPEQLAGVGQYAISASVISPAINVLCVNMNETALAPIVYTAWPNATTNTTDIPGQKVAWANYGKEIGEIMRNGTKLNSTVVDDIFHWGYEKYGRYPPVFAMYPFEFNSITNISVFQSDSLYLLIKPAYAVSPDYTVCQLRAYLNTNCSTRYSVSGLKGAQLESHCEDPADRTAYFKSLLPDDAPINRLNDWRNIGSEWMQSLSLNTGLSTANSATARLLSQFIVTDTSAAPKLGSLLPSIAEHLAVMAGNTLLLSSTDSTFYHYWNYTANVLNPGSYEKFNASISTEEYTSGITQRWQGMFYLVLLLVFVTNVFCLVYFFLYSGLVTDYTETQNLFALAVNSPPSNKLHGSCGAGPSGEQLNVDWHIKADTTSGHFFIKESGVDKGKASFEMRRRGSHNLKSMNSYSRLSAKRGSWL